MLAYEAKWAKEAELRELGEENKRLKSESKKPAVQFEVAGGQTKPDEGFEMDGEADSRRKLDLRKKERSRSSCEKLRRVPIWMRISWRSEGKVAARVPAG